jgi:uncharacterized protein YbjT (DUF2867 family)
MNILVTGANGQLGYDVLQELTTCVDGEQSDHCLGH